MRGHRIATEHRRRGGTEDSRLLHQVYDVARNVADGFELVAAGLDLGQEGFEFRGFRQFGEIDGLCRFGAFQRCLLCDGHDAFPCWIIKTCDADVNYTNSYS